MQQHVGAPITIRSERAGDVEAIRRIVAAAFGRDIEADLVDRIRASLEYVPETALVALLDGEVVGHVMISRALLRGEAGERPIGMLAPLAVVPERQGIGVGGALVRRATELADRRGEPLVVLEGSPRYYGRFGFEPAVAHGVELPLPAWAPSEAAQVLLLSSYDATDPTLHGAVVYPPTFDGVE